VLAAGWKFLGSATPQPVKTLDSLYALGRRIRNVSSETELSAIEEEIDDILKRNATNPLPGTRARWMTRH